MKDVSSTGMTTSKKSVGRGATPPVPKPGEPILSGNGQDSGLVQDVLLLGIDLGTSRSSIVSMNGSRRTIDSYVGWPRDAVSRKFFKSDVVFGRAALDNRLALDLYRPLERGVIKGTNGQAHHAVQDNGRDLEAAGLLLKHLVEHSAVVVADGLGEIEQDVAEQHRIVGHCLKERSAA